MTVLIAAAALSLAAQVAQARHSLTGWLLAAVPALAFLALSKLVLSRTTTPPRRPAAHRHDEPQCPAQRQPGRRRHAAADACTTANS